MNHFRYNGVSVTRQKICILWQHLLTFHMACLEIHEISFKTSNIVPCPKSKSVWKHGQYFKNSKGSIIYSQSVSQTANLYSLLRKFPPCNKHIKFSEAFGFNFYCKQSSLQTLFWEQFHSLCWYLFNNAIFNLVCLIF